MTRYILPVDVGQADDFTALGIMQPKAPELHLNFAKRLPLKMPYPQMADFIGDLAQRKPLRDNVDIIVDYTGVGRPFVDMLRAKGLAVIPVTITGGAEESYDREDGAYRVPKRVLVTCIQILVQSKRLRISNAIPIAADIQREMIAFKATIKNNAHVQYGNDWREAAHDDLVLMMAIGAWWFSKFASAPDAPALVEPANTWSEEHEEWSEAQLDQLIAEEQEERKRWGYR